MNDLQKMDINMYIISKDSPKEHNELFTALNEKIGISLPFISDPELRLINYFNMKNGDVSYRGYGMMDREGKVVFNTINDHWGEQIDQTVKEIQKEHVALLEK
jgi:alkyl hydroperoxide reductase subunit AhpC